jgi:hypothetical protein
MTTLRFTLIFTLLVMLVSVAAGLHDADQKEKAHQRQIVAFQQLDSIIDATCR